MTYLSSQQRTLLQEQPLLVQFYLDQCPNLDGRKITEIWAWDNDQLSGVHNYIQWLFPLQEKSRFNSTAPVLNDAIIQAFKESEQLRHNLLRSWRLMLQYYGLQCQEPDHPYPTVGFAADYPQRQADWLNPQNHNYLRITRILTSLQTLGCPAYAQAFFNCLAQIYQQESHNIGEQTFLFWKKAVTSHPF